MNINEPIKKWMLKNQIKITNNFDRETVIYYLLEKYSGRRFISLNYEKCLSESREWVQNKILVYNELPSNVLMEFPNGFKMHKVVKKLSFDGIERFGSLSAHISSPNNNWVYSLRNEENKEVLFMYVHENVLYEIKDKSRNPLSSDNLQLALLFLETNRIKINHGLINNLGYKVLSEQESSIIKSTFKDPMILQFYSKNLFYNRGILIPINYNPFDIRKKMTSISHLFDFSSIFTNYNPELSLRFYKMIVSPNIGFGLNLKSIKKEEYFYQKILDYHSKVSLDLLNKLPYSFFDHILNFIEEDRVEYLSGINLASDMDVYKFIINLTKKGYDFNLYNKSKKNEDDIMGIILKFSEKFPSFVSTYKQEMLSFFSEIGYIKIVKYLVEEQEANVSFKNNEALAKALSMEKYFNRKCHNQHLKNVVYYLINHGADIFDRNGRIYIYAIGQLEHYDYGQQWFDFLTNIYNEKINNL